VPDRPIYDRIDDPENVPVFRFLNKQFDRRTAKEWFNYLGEMFDLILDSNSILNNMGTVTFPDQSQPAPGVNVHTVTLQLTDMKDDPIASEQILEIGAFDDAGFSTPASNAQLKNVTAGTLLSTAPAAALKVKTDATGKVTFDVEDLVDEQVHVAAAPSFGSIVLSHDASYPITFS